MSTTDRLHTNHSCHRRKYDLQQEGRPIHLREGCTRKPVC